MINTPPSPFSASNSLEIKAGTRFHRVRDQRFGSCTFNPGKGLPTRFAPLFLGSGSIPTQYLATDYECAVHETTFHDVPIDELNKTVGVDNIKPLAHSIIKLKHDLVLVPLFAPDLAKWGVNRADLIDTTAADYHITALWAFAIHQSRPDAHSLIWTSKRCDPQQAVLLFGDRVAETDLTGISNVAIYSDVGEMRQVPGSLRALISPSFCNRTVVACAPGASASRGNDGSHFVAVQAPQYPACPMVPGLHGFRFDRCGLVAAKPVEGIAVALPPYALPRLKSNRTNFVVSTNCS
jgi:hypothetical protein